MCSCPCLAQPWGLPLGYEQPPNHLKQYSIADTRVEVCQDSSPVNTGTPGCCRNLQLIFLSTMFLVGKWRTNYIKQNYAYIRSNFTCTHHSLRIEHTFTSWAKSFSSISIIFLITSSVYHSSWSKRSIWFLKVCLLFLQGHFYKDIFTYEITLNAIYHVLDTSFWFTPHNTKSSGQKIMYFRYCEKCIDNSQNGRKYLKSVCIKGLVLAMYKDLKLNNNNWLYVVNTIG